MMSKTNEGRSKVSRTVVIATLGLIAVAALMPAAAARVVTTDDENGHSCNIVNPLPGGKHIKHGTLINWPAGTDPDYNGNGLVCSYVYRIP